MSFTGEIDGIILKVFLTRKVRTVRGILLCQQINYSDKLNFLNKDNSNVCKLASLLKYET